MCGIVGIVSRPSGRKAPEAGDLARRLETAARDVKAWEPGTGAEAFLAEAAKAAQEADEALGGFAGLEALRATGRSLEGAIASLEASVEALDVRLDQGAERLDPKAVEAANAALVRLKDAAFSLRHDRLENVARVKALLPKGAPEGAWRAAYDVNLVLNALDRLEVRGRDSAGLHLFVHGFEGALPRAAADTLQRREAVPDFVDGAAREAKDPAGGRVVSLVYKVASEIGRLGDNVRVLRQAVAGDALLHALLALPGAQASVLAHTRWASVGVVSQENAHPLNQERADEEPLPYVVGALNGDVDNHVQLVREAGLSIAPSITTDAKVIPALIATRRAQGESEDEAFRRSVQAMEGSVAIATQSAESPDVLRLALRGSGQALYVGLAEDAFLVASEPYGLVEAATQYLRLDGETPLDPDRPQTRGQIVTLDAAHAGERAGLQRFAYDGTGLPVTDRDLKRLAITTRDAARGRQPHYLRKEIFEAPESVRKTVRGKILQTDKGPEVRLGEESLPQRVKDALRKGLFARMWVIGQGTAAVAGQGVTEFLRTALRPTGMRVEALPASEVSGFHLRDDMREDLVLAISQSGTTTDTNRTVDLLRSRGATVLAIVNRRHSDLAEKADGVLYTSDGRDVEMSVASTKAFYSQIAAGVLLSEALADAAGRSDPARRQRLLEGLKRLPGQMREVLETEERVKDAARRTAPYRRHWAVVGNGRNRVAAAEIRIKLSELCYKSIACDATEDKKHIDLSSEPLVLVCAAGIEGSTAADVEKEVEIFAAHKACPIVVATKGKGAWRRAAAVLEVPEAEPDLTFVLATMVGHLFGYHAALSIDALALPLREARAAVEDVEREAEDPRPALQRRLYEPWRPFLQSLSKGGYDGVLDASLAQRLALSYRYATGILPLENFVEDHGRPGTPTTALQEFVSALTLGIDLLTRPVDAIKHQAKTVTVGISRSDEALLKNRLVRAVLSAGAPADRLAYQDLKELEALDAAVTDVLGWTRYGIEAAAGTERIRVLDRGGVSASLRSGTEKDATLKGTKHTVALERRLLVAVGRSDGRPILLVPERLRGECAGIVLLHARFRDDLDPGTVKTVLAGYRNRYALIRDAVVETGNDLEDSRLARIPVLDLLTLPVLTVADRVTSTS